MSLSISTCWSMAALLRDSSVVVRTRPIPPAMITMRKSIHRFPLVPYMGMELRLTAFRSAGAPLLLSGILTKEMKNSNLFLLSTHYCKNFKTILVLFCLFAIN